MNKYSKKLQHLVDFGILEECDASECTLSFFIVDKRDGQVRQISDHHSLKKCQMQTISAAYYP